MEVALQSRSNVDGEIARKFGDTEVRTLRNIYSKGLAIGFPEATKLAHLIGRVDEAPFSQIRQHYEDGSLARRIRDAGG